MQIRKLTLDTTLSQYFRSIRFGACAPGILLALFTVIQSCSPPAPPVPLTSGLVINEAMDLEPGSYVLPGNDSLDQPVIVIEGNDLELDFSELILIGNENRDQPDTYKGVGILVRNSRNVTLKNLTVRGYKVALMAENVDSLRILNSDLSYNYRPRLYSLRERENLVDWLSYHDNEADEWLRYGAGIYLKNCEGLRVEHSTITQNQNALLMTGCNGGQIVNNTFNFNSGLGIGMYRSSRNNVLHNRLDWNVRGYSHNVYQRGQDSAGILCYEQSNDNVFAYNSATHSGDGFFLWAGQTTMDSGEGGCNGNLLYANNFSHAPTNGVEVTFSSNRIIGNRMEECRYGIWGGYSWETEIIGNTITDSQFGLAIEHGQDNVIRANLFENDTVGIRLWQRDQEPSDWGYAQARDTRSRDYLVEANQFVAVPKPITVEKTSPGKLINNEFYRSPLPASGLGEGWEVKDNFIGTRVRPDSVIDPAALNLEGLPRPHPQAQDVKLPLGHPKGRRYILINEWGPYNFEYPSVWLRDIKEDEYIFLLLGPTGNWKAIDGTGFLSIVPKTGTFPATVRARRAADSQDLSLQFEFIGEAFTDQFGGENRRGAAYPFPFYRFEPTTEWEVKWYAYDAATDPTENYDAFRNLNRRQPLAGETVPTLGYRWWGAPNEKVPADKFATFASSRLNVQPGKYRFTFTSDDGLRVYLDGERVIDHWDIHEAAVDTFTVDLDGEHLLEVEHFEAAGMGTLDFYMEKVR
ncbi:right-handed parallel beta-helix repeat-containing protein [Flavilitoribacter nigricans]|nr:right-handed parallel beta-helix repeat-containing protein [Flavilitoribacter nigricans]